MMTSRIHRPTIHLALAAALAASASAADAPMAQAAWKDPSHHAVRRVETEPGVRLEVVDWGGTGEALVFLAGFGNTAHVFDGFAPRFTHRFHVIGITRRGFGASDKPATGYDSETLSRDVLAVLDEMRIFRAAFVAHGFGGSELNWLGVHAAARVDRLVYLDGAYEFQEYGSPLWDAAPVPLPRGADAATPEALTAWYEVYAGHGYPEAEVRAMSALDAFGRVAGVQMVDSAAQKLAAGIAPAAFRMSDIPRLAVYGIPQTVQEKYPWWNDMTPEERTEARRRFVVERDMAERQRANFRTEARNEWIYSVRGGRHYVFLTNEEEVEVIVRRFLQGSAIPLRRTARPQARLGAG
jgi:non-heme chloroperoxidase